MPNALELMGQGMYYRTNSTPAAAVGIMAADTVVGGLTSFAIGEVYGRWGDLPGAKGWLAKHSPELLGGVGKALETALTVFVGPGLASGLAGAVGQAGVNAFTLDLGLSHARKSKGIICVKVPAGTDVKKLKRGDAVPGATAVGELPAAAAGHGLAWDHIQDLASSH